MKTRSRHFITPTIFIFLIVVGGIVGFFVLHPGVFQHQIAKTEPKPSIFPRETVYPQYAPPTPGPGKTTYTNTKYGYSFVYPSDWKLNTYTNQNNVDVIQGRYQVIAGDSYPFDLSCLANPNELDAQSWFKQNGAGTGIGYITLKSGFTAYLSIGHAQVGWKNYTIVHGHVACDFTTYSADDAINQINNVIVNSFIWR